MKLKLFGNDLTFNGGKVYHEEDKPTAQDVIGAYARHERYVESGSNFNEFLDPGCYEVRVGHGWNAQNCPPSNFGLWPWGLLVVHSAKERAERRYVQIYYPYRDNQSPVRRMTNQGNWLPWRKEGHGLNAQDIGAANSNHTHADMTTRTISDWNNAGGNGFLQAENAQNAPNNDTGWYWGFKMQHRVGYGAQILVKNQSPRMFFRAQTTDGSGEWNEVYHTNNKPTPQDIGAATEDHTHDNITTLQAQVEELQERNRILEEGLNLLAEGNVEQLRAILKSTKK